MKLCVDSFMVTLSLPLDLQETQKAQFIGNSPLLPTQNSQQHSQNVPRNCDKYNNNF